jgi:hypothetical protein
MSDRAAHRGIVYITEADLNRLRTLIAVMRNAGYNKVREYLEVLTKPPFGVSWVHGQTTCTRRAVGAAGAAITL